MRYADNENIFWHAKSIPNISYEQNKKKYVLMGKQRYVYPFSLIYKIFVLEVLFLPLWTFGWLRLANQNQTIELSAHFMKLGLSSFFLWIVLRTLNRLS